MKLSEMTNEQIADKIEQTYCASSSEFGLTMREAAARLRTFTLLSKAHQRLANDSVDNESNILSKLKVAKDALEKLQDRLVSSVHDGTIDPHEALEIAENALSAIREEGGANA